MRRSSYLRPRGAFARTLYEKIHKDQELRSLNKDEWYRVDEEEMMGLSTELWRKFNGLNPDQETEEFLDNCFDTSDSFCWQFWLTIANSILSWFLTPTSINGLLGRGSMMVYSSNQFQLLIDSQRNDGLLLDSLLDIGAGDGSTTDRMKRLFNRVYVTEMSKPMKWSLANKGFTVLDEQNWDSGEKKFDVVTCLNVLDRCETPLSLLRSIKRVLKPDGVAIVSFVIPFSPYVEFGDNSRNTQPNETLPVAGKSFCEEVFNFANKVLDPEGWNLVRWSKLPYLCHGNFEQAYYWLTDAVFVIQPRME